MQHMLIRPLKVTLFTALLSAISLGAAGIESQIIKRLERPDPPGTTTPVVMNAFIVNVMEIDDVRGTIKLDYLLRQSWKDPRLADSQFQDLSRKQNLTIDDIWNPGISQINILDSVVKETLLNIDADGTVEYRLRLMDTFNDPLDLRDFPFDKQDFNLGFVSTSYIDHELAILWNQERSGHMENFSLTGWHFEGINVITDWKPIRIGGIEEASLEGIDIQVHFKRRFAFYIWKIFVPLGLIAFMAWTVFWIDPVNFGGQMAISTSSVITLIAFQLSLSDLMPRISYLTKIDMFSLGTSFFVFLSLGEAILTARLAKMERHQLALKIDRWMRIVFPLIYCGLILLVFI